MIAPILSRIPHGFCTGLVGRAAAPLIVFALALLATPAAAHLSIIRQGHESRGANEPGDRFGASLAVGDFNGDGIEDLAIGAPNEAVGALANAGAVFVHWGTPLGVTHVNALLITAADAGALNQAQMEFGYALAAGDFNHDGHADLAIGAPGSNLGISLVDAGQVLVMAGGINGLSNWLELNQADASGAQEANDRFGSSLAVGNFNADATPYADLAVGAPGENSGAGAVSWFTGSLLGLGFTDRGTARPSDIGGTNQVNARFGEALAAANLLGTVHDDLAVGVPFFDDAQSNAGGVWLMRGAAGGLSNAGAIFLTAWDVDQIEADANFGAALATGRLFDGSYSSLAIGEPRRDGFGRQNVGRVITARGALGGLDLANAVIVHQGGSQAYPEADDLFGTAISVGSFAGHMYDYLAIGAPGEDVPSASENAGEVDLLFGSPSGPNPGYMGPVYTQFDLGEDPADNEHFGLAVAFGMLDGSGRGHLVVGAPGEDNSAGQVHVVAPWRQPESPACRNSVAYDCEGNLVFSQKPFDQVYIASTTKVMTVLLACERSQLPPGDPGYLDLDEEYTVPEWIAYQIPGSQVPLVAGERLTVRDLLFTCLLLSGNDAANAIAHAIYGGNELTCLPAFVAEMNARAAQLGMTGTHFHNPAGLDQEPVGIDLGEHYSTPVDMATLSRAAMANPFFAQIAGTLEYATTRHIPNGGGGFIDQAWSCQSFFTGVILNQIQPATGIKGGRTPKAKSTGLFSAESEAGGTAIATTFLTDPNSSQYVSDAAHLLSIALEECSSPLVFNPEHLPFHFNVPGLSTLLGDAGGGTSTLDIFDQRIEDLTVDLFRTQGSGFTSARPELRRFTQITFEPTQSVPFGISPFDAHGEMVLFNLGDTEALIRVTRSYLPGIALDLTIPVGGRATIPAFDSPTQLGDGSVNLLNLSGSGRLPASLSVEEHYIFDLPQIAAGDGSVFEARIERSGGILDDSFELVVYGRDPNPGSVLFAMVRDYGSTADVFEVDPGSVSASSPGLAARGLSASPNPFAARTELSFELLRPGRAELRIFDVAGREVHGSGETSLRAGRWNVAWDGRSADRRVVPPGIYFYRLYVDGAESGGGKLVRIR